MICLLMISLIYYEFDGFEKFSCKQEISWASYLISHWRRGRRRGTSDDEWKDDYVSLFCCCYLGLSHLKVIRIFFWCFILFQLNVIRTFFWCYILLLKLMYVMNCLRFFPAIEKSLDRFDPLTVIVIFLLLLNTTYRLSERWFICIHTGSKLVKENTK